MTIRDELEALVNEREKAGLRYVQSSDIRAILATAPALDREAIEDAVLGIELTREFDVTEDDAAIIADAILDPIPPALGNAIPGLQAAVDMAEALTIRPGNSRADQHRNEDESWTS